MKCKNKFCCMYRKGLSFNCGTLDTDKEIEYCEAKERFDKFVLVNGIGEIDTGEESSDGK
jgi:hypothetical protein